MSRAPIVPSVIDMNLLTKIFVSLAITCGAAWLLKQVAIVATGGGDAESPLVGVLWATGMLTFLLAAAVGTALAAAARSRPGRASLAASSRCPWRSWRWRSSTRSSTRSTRPTAGSRRRSRSSWPRW